MDYRQRQQLHDFTFTSKTKQQNVRYKYFLSSLFAHGCLETVLTSPVLFNLEKVMCQNDQKEQKGSLCFLPGFGGLTF